MVPEINSTDANVDVLIIGAGISGINAGYRIHEAFPQWSYTILEAREELGGTWSLFQFPGIRSDSDLHTFGFPWDPWTEDRPIADGPSILKYMKTVVAKHGIDKHIKYEHRATKLEWSSGNQRWTAEVIANGTKKKYVSKFVFVGTGIFDYNEGQPSTIPGIENFEGTVAHPQFWPSDLDYDNKRIIIIGSGATAITLLPALTDRASFVTMLQRSPSYLFTPPSNDPVDNLIRKFCPTRWMYKVLRWKYIVGFMVIYNFSIWFPEAAKKLLRQSTESQLPSNIPFDPHFVPKYNPWEQRMCVAPHGDFFAALRSGNADIVTDHIDMVDKAGIVLKSGGRLDTDIIVTATGLKLTVFGQLEIVVDGRTIDHSDKFTWRGSALQDVPNFFFAFGYTNASWTLGADTATLLFLRVMKEMQDRGVQCMVPTMESPHAIKEVPWLNLNSNYIQRAVKDRRLPKAGDIAPWKPRSSYIQDYLSLSWGSEVTAGLKFGPQPYSQNVA
ncbi:Flavin-binding monooxygenase [Aspergillus sclerotialis]|uniref:Flavin-binding monooxygenase n=1 Tax=Aspergillus sclerotialis TaxID=2070753 RepID=A0A3A2ZPQ2_9EURO|nr:Flavin-binding monooxygenase [Aspergillus sclerotialis]